MYSKEVLRFIQDKNSFFILNMYLNVAKKCILAIVFTSICGNSVKSNHKPDIKKDGSLECSTNYYLNGNVCTECPAGYFGDNCSSTCPSSFYGSGCTERCSCSYASCHHVFGCNITKECSYGYGGQQNCSKPCLPPNYGTQCREVCDCSNSSCHHIYGCNITTSLTQEEDTHKKITTRNVLVSKYARVTIISSGILISTLLLLLIAREFYRLSRISALQDSRQFSGDTSEVVNIYDEVGSYSHDHSRNA